MSKRTTLTAGDFIPALFIGSPVALILPGLLLQVTGIAVALAIGAVAGLALGLAVIRAIRQG